MHWFQGLLFAKLILANYRYATLTDACVADNKAMKTLVKLHYWLYIRTY
jgi:hypothetical protein